MGVKCESPGLAGAYFKSSSIVADWVELVRHADSVYFVRFRWFWALTRKQGVGMASKGKDGGLGLEAVWVEKRVSPLRGSR